MFRPRCEELETRLAPAILTVNTVVDSTSTGPGILSLREAVGLVNHTLSITANEQSQVSGTLGSNDTIQFNLPAGAQTITLTGGALSLSRMVTINGPGAGNLTISANYLSRVFAVSKTGAAQPTTINGLSIYGGTAAYGGAVLNNGTLAITNCVIAGSSAGNSGGGGIYNAGTLTLNYDSFTGDTVSSGGSGGGVQNATSSTLTASNCIFSSNTATGSGNSASQGAALAVSGRATISNTTLIGNSATSDGGAIYISSAGSLSVISSAFTNNTAGSDGGAIRNGGTLTLSYCLFNGNTTSSWGGAIDTSHAMTATGCTFAGNTAGSQGGALDEESGGAATLYNTTITANRVTSGSSGRGGGLYGNGPITLFNTIVAGNFQGPAPSTQASDIAGSVTTNSAYNLIGTGGAGALVNGTNGNQVGVANPGLGTLANYGGPTLTVPLLAGSPAIGHGSNAYVTAGETDQRGLARVVNGTVDIGAFEVQNPAAPPAAALVVTGFPSSTTAGTAGSVTVTVKDANGNIVTGYTGTVHFTSSDSQASLPPDYTFVPSDNGVHTFTVTYKTAGSESLTATDTQTATVTGSESGITVAAAAANHFTVAGFPSPATAGTAANFTVTAFDAYGNIAAGYTGTVHVTSSDSQAALPANYTFGTADNGVHVFSATFKSAGTQTLSATDTLAPGVTGTESGITVSAGTANTLTITGLPATATAGTAGTFTVTIRDVNGNIDTAYAGTVHFTSSDSQAALPADYTYSTADNGVHTFTATFKTAGSESVTVTDTTTAALAATAGVNVTPAAANTLVVAGFPSPATAGTAGAFTVTARDAYGNLATGYTGTVHFTSSDAQAVLPADYTFTLADQGTHTFSVTLKSAGRQSITVTDAANASVSGTPGGIMVTPAAATGFAVAGFPANIVAGTAGTFMVVALDAFGNTATGYTGTVHFTSTDAQATLPADTTLSGGVGNFAATFQTVGTQTLTATDTASASMTGSQTGIQVTRAGPYLMVNSTADSTTPDSFLTLREAIDLIDGTLGRALTAGEQAQVNGPIGPNDVILFSLPAGQQTITLTGGALDITNPVAIQGPGGGNLTINGGNTNRVFIVGHDYSQNLSLNVTISGVTITGGSAVTAGHNYGGGLLNFGTLTISNDNFTGNVAGNDGGGAVYNDGVLTAANCTFQANSVNAGGSGAGLINTTSGTATLTGCTFTNNTGTGGAQGAGVANSGKLTVVNSWFVGNTTDSDGGGIYNSGAGTLTMSGSTLVNNDAGSDGGGIHSDGAASISTTLIAFNAAASEGGGMDNQGTLTMTNCTLYNNVAVSSGGGLMTYSTTTLTNCTITANEVTTGSSGVYGGGICIAGSPVRLFNTIVAGNFHDPNTTPDDIAGSVDSSSAFNLIGTGGSGGLTNGSNNNQVGVANAGLAALADNGGLTETVALLPGSSAIGHGSNTYVTAGETDERGFARIVNGTVDIGAFEVQ